MSQITNLDELFAALRAGDVELSADLPVFASEWENPEGVWSWDETRAIVGTCTDDLEILERSEIDW